MNFNNEMIITHKCDFILAPGADPTTAVCRFCHKNIMEDLVLPEPKEEKPLEFVKYRSIHNTYLDKVIERIRLEVPASALWVAVNKIHGSNFSIMGSADQVIPCTRERIIPKNESHFGHERMMPYLSKIIKEIQSYFGYNVHVFFEIFGGAYNHPDVARDSQSHKVQREVCYTPYNDIRVIDIKVDETFLDWDEMVEISWRHGLIPALEMHRGTLDEMLALSPEFDDPTYKDYALPKIDGNISEGFVVRPIKEIMLRSGRRPILKNKSSKFSEKKQRKQVQKVPVVLNETEQIAFDNLIACVTENRLNNILSHGETFTDSDFNKLVNLMIQDIFKEESEQSYTDNMSKAEKKQVNKLLRREISNFVRPIFLQMVQNF